MLRRSLLFGALLLAAVLLLLGGSQAARAVTSFPSGFASQAVVTGLSAPTAISWTSDGRMFIAEKSGIVRVYKNGSLSPNPFIDISNEVNDTWDRGLLGLAVHPSFPTQPYVYLLYTYDPPELPGSRYQVDGPDGEGERVSRLLRVTADSSQQFDVAMPGSELVLLGTNSTLANIAAPDDFGGASGAASCEVGGVPVQDCLPSDSLSHSVGSVVFGPDGSLFVSHGEGSDWTRPQTRTLRALNVDSLAGKVLRINPDTGQGYPDNPFYDGDPSHNRSKVWASGLRNPFRIAVHPVSGQPYVGDVGWGSWEEVNTGKGKNFGWPCYEGDDTGSAVASAFAFDPATESTCQALYALGTSAVQAPWYAYPHNGLGASITGLAFYQASLYPELYRGALFIADYDQGWIRYLTVGGGGEAVAHNFAQDVTPSGGIVQLTLGPDGMLYYVLLDFLGDSQIRRIFYDPNNTPPTAQLSAQPTIGDPPLAVSFSSAGSFDPEGGPLTYAWAFGDGFTSTITNPTHIYTATGKYTAVLTVTDQLFASGSNQVQIVVGDRVTATITSPISGTTYRVGQTLNFTGSGRSQLDGVLPPSNLLWRLFLHHETHVHASTLGPGRSRSYLVDDHGDDVWLEVCLTATDAQAVSDTRCIHLYPELALYRFESQPPGLTLSFASLSGSTPFTFPAIVGSVRQLSAPSSQAGLVFKAWAHGGPASQPITVTNSMPRTFVATYVSPMYLPLMWRGAGE